MINKKIIIRISNELGNQMFMYASALGISKKILKICKKSRKKLIIIKNGDHSLSRKKDLKKICDELKDMIKRQTI